MTVIAQPVYTASSLGVHGCVAEFLVQPKTFRDPRTVLTLPAECMLTGEPGDLRIETRFRVREDGSIDSYQGKANEQLIAAVKVIIGKSILPFDHRVGVVATFAGDRVVVVTYLKSGVSLQETCREIANVVFENVADVIVRPARIRSLSVRERTEWLAFNAADQA